MGHANRHRKPSSTARRVRATGVVAGVAVLPLCFATPASAAPAAAPTADGDRMAVVGPLLDFFYFGSSIGAPVFCGAVSASLGSGFQEFGAVEQGNLLVDGIDQGCAAFSEQGTAFVEQGKAAQAPYAQQVNPALNPVIEQFATAVGDFGATFEPALAPFGPTVAGSGNTIRFLLGTTPEG
ncbi:hypothetical protein GCM10009547_19820 [Sporichthya brevicatena]|uniref:Uncharacterized protein n=1 Tax=Sporichthya brevicatena TaxID=171442 RepID=A0ABN1GRT9_9ACTN